MKRIIYISAVCLLTVLSSCSSVLDEAPSGKISIEEVFRDNDMTMNYLKPATQASTQRGAFTSSGAEDLSTGAMTHGMLMIWM